jgi:hypothetical protein
LAFPFRSGDRFFMVHSGNNHIKDAGKLTEADFPRLEYFWAYTILGKEKNNFSDPKFASKLQTKDLRQLCIRPSYSGIQSKKF